MSSKDSREIFLSVICATRNAAATLPNLLESYKAQRTDETELIVVDACSADSTAEVLERYRQYIDGLIVEPDRSIYDAWNKGVSLAQGRFVCFVGADDKIAPDAITALLSAIHEHNSADYIHGHNIMLRKGRISGLIGRPYTKDILEKYLPMAHGMSAHRRDWVVNGGGFDVSFKSSGDYDFLLRMRKTMRVVDCQAILVYVEDAGISRSSIRPILESFRARQINGVAMVRNFLWTLRGLAGFWIRKIASWLQRN
ncbi:glycosyltransferase [Propionivibrio sp.]|uniref:glycosyltransferase n=1 Tax=Propionivibrio sp. TaxID=2212460 RepID=UPI00260511F1|nr:glycosyltransferase [Propionivibrio sp.]